jgi:AcrR family transcriptional regulator
MPDGTRQRLITCATTILTAEGISAVTIRRVAREAGVSHGAPLRHFPNLAALLSAVSSAGFASLHARVAAVEGAPRDRLVAACRSYMDFARSAPALHELMFRLCPMESAAFTQFCQLASAAQLPRLHAASLWASLYGLVHMHLEDALDVTLATYLP